MNWNHFKKHYFEFTELDFAIDLSHMDFPRGFFEEKTDLIEKAFKEMHHLESGAIANPDESRMVGHYWLRSPKLAPSQEITTQINQTLDQILDFTEKVHSGKVTGSHGPFKNILIIGIGGSALGPQFVKEALGNNKTDKMAVFFLDNTDPKGIRDTLTILETALGKTLCLVISKSGGTPETRNAMLETKDAYEKAGLVFSDHAVAITGQGSKMDQIALREAWLTRFPMWDWVGGRTSEMATVGLLPACLQGIDILELLKGAREMDEKTRIDAIEQNPAALLALSWFQATKGVGEKAMVVLPYKDRLQLFSKYLQQLVMESLGKEHDLNGKCVEQGIVVYGNKGSTDQHAYVQQLRDGTHNFFATFIEVLEDGIKEPLEVEKGITSGDYLQGFLLGTRKALYEKGRNSITLTIRKVDARSIGALIALYERSVGLYATLVGINAYHQPGVEAGKKAAGDILKIKKDITSFLKERPSEFFTVEALNDALELKNRQETIFKLLQNLGANSNKKISVKSNTDKYLNTYGYVE